jgi:hypothetical protein
MHFPGWCARRHIPALIAAHGGASERFVRLALVLQRSAQVVVRFGIVRPEFQGPTIARHRLDNPTQAAIDYPQAVLEVRRKPV